VGKLAVDFPKGVLDEATPRLIRDHKKALLEALHADAPRAAVGTGGDRHPDRSVSQRNDGLNAALHVAQPGGERGAIRPWDAEPTPLQLALARGHHWLAMLESHVVRPGGRSARAVGEATKAETGFGLSKMRRSRFDRPSLVSYLTDYYRSPGPPESFVCVSYPIIRPSASAAEGLDILFVSAARQP
jgi:hypothetical protein